MSSNNPSSNNAIEDYEKLTGIPRCNVIGSDGNYYYSSDKSLPNKYLSVNYFLYIGLGFIIFSIIMMILVIGLINKDEMGTAIPSILLLCCFCSISGSNFYQYFTTTKALSDISSDPKAQPCLDGKGLIIYTGTIEYPPAPDDDDDEE
jgi:hypothetical protein